jgi:hypothetical protein
MSKSSSGPIVSKKVRINENVRKRTTYYGENSGDEGADPEENDDKTIFESKERPRPRPRTIQY